MKQAALQHEVDAKIYFGLTDKELHASYNAHRDKFASVTLSEIFLSLAGRTESDVKAHADQLSAQARAAGADFGALVAKDSENDHTKKGAGLLTGEDGRGT